MKQQTINTEQVEEVRADASCLGIAFCGIAALGDELLRVYPDAAEIAAALQRISTDGLALSEELAGKVGKPWGVQQLRIAA